MVNPLHKASIGTKIFGLAASILGLLIVVVYISHERLRQVHEEVTDLAEYVIPVTNLMAKVDVHVLEQELHFERALRLAAVEYADPVLLEKELAQFEARGEQVDEELVAAEQLVDLGIKKSLTEKDRQEFLKLKPQLQQIEREHQEFHERAVELFSLLEQGKLAEYRQKQPQFARQEDEFNQAIESVLHELGQFTINAAQQGQHHQQSVLRLSAAIATIALVVGLLYASLVTLGVIRPIRSLTQSIQAIRAGDLDTNVAVNTEDEVGRLAQSFNRMVRELQLKEKLKETFGKYVDPRVVANLLANPDTTHTAGEKQVMTVFFAEIEGFDAIAAALPPNALVKWINDYLSLMSAPVAEHQGVIDKFIDTKIMGFWGPPFTSAEEHAQQACLTALDQIARLPQLRQLVARTVPSLAPLKVDFHIGIATGMLVVGNMGSATSRSYTVMGDAVNTAARLKGASQQYGVRTLITRETQRAISETIATREIDRVRLVGKDEPVEVYQLLGEVGTLDATTRQLQIAFSEGLQVYRQQDWQQAQQAFERCLQLKPDDGPTQVFLQRIQTFQQTPPLADWDGVWQLTQK